MKTVIESLKREYEWVRKRRISYEYVRSSNDLFFDGKILGKRAEAKAVENRLKRVIQQLGAK